jgi:hypothetical protein
METICIDDSFSEIQKKLIPNRPVKDKIYTFRDVFKLPNESIAVHLNEITNPELTHPSGLGTFEPSFNIERFTTLLGEPIKKEEYDFEKKLWKY